MLHSSPLSQSPWFRLVALLSFVLLGAFLGQLVSTQLVPIDTKSMTNINEPLPSFGSLLVFQAVTASSAFIVFPLFYWHIFGGRGTNLWFLWDQRYTRLLPLTLSLVLSFMIVNTWFVYWNRTIKLPVWLHTFEAWAQAQETAMQRISNQLTTFHSLQDLGAGILVIAFIPAIGEELLFRGLIQPLCYQITRNAHSAITISAFAFSAVHLQFYGFVPRFLLGSLFGYIYWWTKDLFFPIAAHFFNNALTLLLIFLYQTGNINLDITSPTLPTTAIYILATLLVTILSYYLKQFSKKSRL